MESPPIPFDCWRFRLCPKTSHHERDDHAQPLGSSSLFELNGKFTGTEKHDGANTNNNKSIEAHGENKPSPHPLAPSSTPSKPINVDNNADGTTTTTGLRQRRHWCPATKIVKTVKTSIVDCASPEETAPVFGSIANSTVTQPSTPSTPCKSYATNGWTYTPSSSSSHLLPWSLKSSQLLSITYTPRIQSMPSYTTTNCCSRFLSTVAPSSYSLFPSTSFSSVRASPQTTTTAGIGTTVRNATRKRRVYQEIYTRNDIRSIVELPEGQTTIKGVHGTGKTIRVFLSLPEDVTHSLGKQTDVVASAAADDDCDDGGVHENKLFHRFPSDLEKCQEEDEQRRNLSRRELGSDSDSFHDDYEHNPKHKHNDNSNNSNNSKDSTDHHENVAARKRRILDTGDNLPPPPWTLPNNNNKDDEKGEHRSNERPWGPILTFFVPNNNTDNDNDNQHNPPPLLWKVELPPDPTIAMESITVLDGVLDIPPPPSSSSSSPSSPRSPPMDPTHVYVNGWQSWSYAGSVKKGEPQPQSAMPNVCSRAFNYGGDLPPVASTTFGSGVVEGTAVRETNSSCSGVAGTVRRYYNRDKEKNTGFYCSDFYAYVTSSSSSPSSADSAVVKLDRESMGPSLVLGFLSQKRQYGVVTFDSTLTRVAIHASLQGTVPSQNEGISTDWVYCRFLPPPSSSSSLNDGNDNDDPIMGTYLDTIARHHCQSATTTTSFPTAPLPSPLPHPRTVRPLTGWCSWYHYYDNIDFLTLRRTIRDLGRLTKAVRPDVAMIDDGYITAWGDWDSLKPGAFPSAAGGGGVTDHPMKVLADEIRNNNIKPGLWLAPFACDKHSTIVRRHPSWILRSDDGKPSNSSNCGKFFYGLDATNPGVLRHVSRSIRRAVEEWGYEVLKLDFLYAGILDGNGCRWDTSVGRAGAMRMALECVREACGNGGVNLVGCGCPLGSGIGYMDAMRISADTGPTWHPALPLPRHDNSTLPSLRSSIRNTLTRSPLSHRFWHNDPDCLLLGRTTRLTDDEVISSATVTGMTGGTILLSDDLGQLMSKEKKQEERLAMGKKIWPITGAVAQTLDLHTCGGEGGGRSAWKGKGIPRILRLRCSDQYDDGYDDDGSWSSKGRSRVGVAKGLGTWSTVSLGNWSDKVRVVEAPTSCFFLDGEEGTEGEAAGGAGYHVLAFWSAEYVWSANTRLRRDDDSSAVRRTFRPHQSEIFHVKAVTPQTPQYIGGDIHFTCGYEVAEFRTEVRGEVFLRMKIYAARKGFVYLYLPTSEGAGTGIRVMTNGKTTKTAVVGRIPVSSSSYTGVVVRVRVEISADGTKEDGTVTVTF